MSSHQLLDLWGTPEGDAGTGDAGDRCRDTGSDTGKDRGSDRGRDKGGDKGSDTGGDTGNVNTARAAPSSTFTPLSSALCTPLRRPLRAASGLLLLAPSTSRTLAPFVLGLG